MEIDFFTLVAQILNLLILLFLLRKFLYLPVLKAVEARQKLIADEINSAEQARQKAVAAEKKSLAQAQKLEAQKQKILEKAQEDAYMLENELKRKVESEYQQKRKNISEKLIFEQKNFDLAIQKAAADYFMQFAQKALSQIAGTDLNEAAIAKFMQNLKKLSLEEQKKYADAFNNKKNIEIYTALPLSDMLKIKTEQFLREQWNLPETVSFKYKQNAELICGLCVEAEEQLIAWNFENYLQEFGQNMHNSMSQLLTREER